MTAGQSGADNHSSMAWRAFEPMWSMPFARFARFEDEHGTGEVMLSVRRPILDESAFNVMVTLTDSRRRPIRLTGGFTSLDESGVFEGRIAKAFEAAEWPADAAGRYAAEIAGVIHREREAIAGALEAVQARPIRI